MEVSRWLVLGATILSRRLRLKTEMLRLAGTEGHHAEPEAASEVVARNLAEPAKREAEPRGRAETTTDDEPGLRPERGDDPQDTTETH